MAQGGFLLLRKQVYSSSQYATAGFNLLVAACCDVNVVSAGSKYAVYILKDFDWRPFSTQMLALRGTCKLLNYIETQVEILNYQVLDTCCVLLYSALRVSLRSFLYSPDI